jgi:hypothetical protein
VNRTILAAALALCSAATIWPQAPNKEKGDDKSGYTDTPVIPGQKWQVHDAARPKPVKVVPPPPVVTTPAPADAIVLFDGKDLSQWISVQRGGVTGEPKWKVENGQLIIVPRTGRLATKEKFGDMQLHVEWMIPKDTPGAGQGKGNSGIEIMGRYEVQVLESHENVTYADGQAASIYGQWPPRVNASRPIGEWNSYDIIFEAPKFEGEQLVKPAYLTVLHNGVMVHNRQEVMGTAIHRRVATYRAHGEEEPLTLQDHGNPVHYRNIWVRKLKPYDAQ